MFDVSLVTIDKGLSKVLATDGYYHMGGEDFKRGLTEHFVERWVKLGETKHPKIELQTGSQVPVGIEAFSYVKARSESLTRGRLEK